MHVATYRETFPAMQQRDAVNVPQAQKTFRSDVNSPFIRHLTHIHLLCYLYKNKLKIK